MIKVRLAAALLAIAFSSALTGCGGGGGGSSSTPTTGVQVRLKDAPGNFQHVNVTISAVQVVDANNGVTTISNSPQTFDLLALQNVDAVIGTATLPPGDYTQVRLIVSSASVVDNGGVTHAVTVPSGAQTGIKLVDNFTITQGQITSITLDFDAAHSIVQTGNSSSPQGIRYLLKPVIKVVAQVISGQITGTVHDSTTSQPIAATNNPLVTAYPAGSPTDGTVPASATATVSETDGSYTLTPLPAGSYDLYFTADGYTAQSTTDVAVTANATTTESTINLVATGP